MKTWTTIENPIDLIEARQLHIEFCGKMLLRCDQAYVGAYKQEIEDCEYDIKQAKKSLEMIH